MAGTLMTGAGSIARFDVAAPASHASSAPPTTTIVAVRFGFIMSNCRVSDRNTANFPSVLLFVVHPVSTGSKVDSVPPLRVVAVIPARYASTRLPGKVLAEDRKSTRLNSSHLG